MATLDREQAQSSPVFGWALHILKYALPIVRPFFKLSADESAAWDVVTGVVDSTGG